MPVSPDVHFVNKNFPITLFEDTTAEFVGGSFAEMRSLIVRKKLG